MGPWVAGSVNSLGGRVVARVERLWAFVVAASCASAFAGVGVAQATGELTYDQCLGTSAGCTYLSGGPLSGAMSVAVSPNGDSVYVGATGGSVGALSHFFVGARGSLAYDGCVSDDGSGGACLNVPGSGGQFERPIAVAVSPNDRSVYTANTGHPAGVGNQTGGGLAHLFANPTQGQLSWDGCVTDGGSGGSCLNAPAAGLPLVLPVSVAISSNGASLYAAALDAQPDTASTVSHLFANPTQGQLSWDGCVTDDGSGGACLDVPGSGTPLTGVRAVAASRNGASVYAMGAGTVSHLFANPIQGQLSWDGCISNDGSGGTCADVPGTGTPLTLSPNLGQDLAISPDGASVYAVTGETVSHLFANPTQGQLSWEGCVSDDGSGGTCADIPGNGSPLSGADAVAISPDGRSLYVASATASAISVFDVGRQGRLTFNECLSDNGIPGCTDPPGNSLAGASGVAVSPNGDSVYVTGNTNGTIAHFFRTTSSTTGGGGGPDSGGGTPGSTVHTVTRTIGNQRVVLSSLLPATCLPKAASLQATLSSNAITGSKATPVRFFRAEFYIDRGVRHIHQKVRRSHGKKTVVTTVAYTPNHTSRRQPSAAFFKLTRLRSGSHTLRVTAFFHRKVVRHGHRLTLTVSTSLSLKIRVC